MTAVAHAGGVTACVWPYAVCSGDPEVRGLCHRHYMQARREGTLRQFPAAAFFGDIDNRRVTDRADSTLCGCDIPHRGAADQCERCGRLIAPDADRVADLRARYRLVGDRAVKRQRRRA